MKETLRPYINGYKYCLEDGYNKYEIHIQKDPLTQKAKFDFDFVSGYSKGGVKIDSYDLVDISLIFSFKVKDMAYFLKVQWWRKQMTIKQGDKISFIFTNGKTLTYIISEKPSKSNEDKGIIMETLIEINSDPDMAIFQFMDFKSWQVKSDNWEITGGGSIEAIIKTIQMDVKNMATAMLHAVSQYQDL